MAFPRIRCQLHDHAKQYDNDEACHSKRNGGKLHENISRNGYGNAIIGRYGRCFEVGVWYRRKLRGTREASNGGTVRVCIIHVLSIVIKNSHTYCKNLLVIEIKYYAHAPRGIDW